MAVTTSTRVARQAADTTPRWARRAGLPRGCQNFVHDGTAAVWSSEGQKCCCRGLQPSRCGQGTAGDGRFYGCFLLADVWRSFVSVGLSSGASGVLAGDPCKAKVKPAHPADPVQRSTSCCRGALLIPAATSNPHTEQPRENPAGRERFFYVVNIWINNRRLLEQFSFFPFNDDDK